MGIYDHVNYKMDCPMCGKDVGDFQTKDLGRFFERVEYWECNNFYSSCDYCNTWIEFTLKNPRPPIPIESYEMKVEPSSFDEHQFERGKDGRIIAIKGTPYKNK